jgi:hypothetical protein
MVVLSCRARLMEFDVFYDGYLRWKYEKSR